MLPPSCSTVREGGPKMARAATADRSRAASDAHTGLRRGETAGLNSGDVDEDPATLFIARTHQAPLVDAPSKGRSRPATGQGRFEPDRQTVVVIGQWRVRLIDEGAASTHMHDLLC